MNDVLREMIARLQAGPTKSGPAALSLGAVDKTIETKQVLPMAVGREQQAVAAIQRQMKPEPISLELMDPIAAGLKTNASATSAEEPPVVSIDARPTAFDGRPTTEALQPVGKDTPSQLPAGGVVDETVRRTDEAGLVEQTVQQIDEAGGVEQTLRRTDEVQSPVELSQRRVAPGTEPRTAEPAMQSPPNVLAIAETLKDELRPMFDELGAKLLRRVRSEGQGRHFRLCANDVD